MTRTLFEFSIPRRLAYGVMLAAAIMTTASVTLSAQAPTPPASKIPTAQLDTLVAPIALYADPLLAQVMLAATFPDQIHSAAEYIRVHGTRDIDGQPWDVSVKAVAHYPTVINMMDAKIDWTTTLGQAYATQSSDLMQAVQDMRTEAQAQGNLVTTPQQEVVAQNGNIAIWPAQAGVIYVPVYDPSVIYTRPCYGAFYAPCFGSYYSFGIGYPIGPWLMYDWDWPGRRIFYTGWVGGGWIGRSRGFIGFGFNNSIYFNDRFRNVGYNRAVVTSPRAVVSHVRGFDGQTGFHRDGAAAAVDRGVTNRAGVPMDRAASRPLVTRSQIPQATSRYSSQPNGASYAPRSSGGVVRQSAPPSRQSAPRQSAPSRGSGSRSSGGRSAGHGRA